MKRHALSIAAFAWGVAEATFFFIVPDVILSYIGLKNGARAGAIASVYAAIGAAVGGVAMYLWSQAEPEAARAAVLALPAISEAMAQGAADAMGENWFAATFFGPLTSTPYKLYAILAPQAGANLGLFALASVAARLPRFVIIAAGTTWIGRALTRRRVSPQTQTWLLAGAWIAFYAAFFALMPN